MLVVEFVCTTYIDARDGTHESGLTMGHMANGADVDGGLARDNLRGKRCQQLDVGVDVLHGQMRLRSLELVLDLH